MRIMQQQPWSDIHLHQHFDVLQMSRDPCLTMGPGFWWKLASELVTLRYCSPLKAMENGGQVYGTAQQHSNILSR